MDTDFFINGVNALQNLLANDGTAFFQTGMDALRDLLTLIGAGLGIWGVVNLLEGYGNDNPGAKSQGMKQFMAGAGIIIVARMLVPALGDLFN